MAKVTDPAVLALLNGGAASPAAPSPSVDPVRFDLSPYLAGGAAGRNDSLSGLTPEFQSALGSLFSSAPPEIQRELQINSAYRSPELQAKLWADALVKYGSPEKARKWVAPPGNSQHNHGNASDLKYLSPAAREWAHANAAAHGLSFPLSNENWHIELSGARGADAPNAVSPHAHGSPSSMSTPVDHSANGAGQRVTDPSVLSLLNSDTPAADATAEESPISLPPIAAPVSVDPAAAPPAAPVDPALAANLAAQDQLRSELPVPGTITNPTVPNAWEQVTGALKNDVRDMGNMVEDAGRNVLSAIEGPGRALQGDPAFQPTIDMTTGEVVSQPPAMIEAATNAAGLTLGNGPGMAARGMLSADPRVAAQAAALARTAAADEFAIPLTRGQATQTLTQQVEEELLRQGTTNASKTIQSFDTAQTAAVGDAVNAMGQRVGAGGADVGPTVMNAVNKIVSDTKDRANQLYGKAFGGDLTIPSSAINALPETVAARLADNDIYIDTAQNGSITPVANAALRIIDERATSLPVKPDGTVDLVQSLKDVERIRRQLVGLEGNTGEDRTAVRAIKQGFDEWLDNAVDRELITGDDEALEALKEARAAWSDYKNLSTAKPGQAAQQAVVKMQKQDATAEEVANWLYGADIASPSLAAPKVAERIKGIVGDESDAWSAVRASAFERLVTNPNTGDPRTPLMISNRIDQFLNNKGETLSRVLFSDEEISELKRFSDVLKTTVTPRNATNPSRSGSTLINAARKLSGQLAGVFGAMAGGPAAGVAAALAYPVFQAAKEGGRAANALKRIEPIAPVAAPPYSNSNVLTRFGITAPSEPAQDVVPENSNVLYQLAT